MLLIYAIANQLILILHLFSFISCNSDAIDKNLTRTATNSCANGFRLIAGNCVDINECEEECNICGESEAVCVNKFGTYECVCDYGYEWRHNACKSVNLILYTTFTSINTLNLDDHNFTDSADINTTTLIHGLSDPREVYYNLHANYILFENIGSIYAYPLIAGKDNYLHIEGDHHLYTGLRANSKLCIDWIHNLIYWISGKDKKKIVAADIRNISNNVVIARVEYYQIKCLAVNPIDSFILWTEYDNENGLFVMNRAHQDGSHKTDVFSSRIMVKEIVIDYRLKRVLLLRADDLLSIDYEGSDERVITRNALHIYDFEVLGDYIYWIEYSGEQLYKASVNGFDHSNRTSISFNAVVNHFQIVNRLLQPTSNAINRCLNTRCIGVCLPLANNAYRCACNEDQCEIIANATITTTTTTTNVSYNNSLSENTVIVESVINSSSEAPLMVTNSTDNVIITSNSTASEENLTVNYTTISVTPLSNWWWVWQKTTIQSNINKASEQSLLLDSKETVTTENPMIIIDNSINVSKFNNTYSSTKYPDIQDTKKADTDIQKLMINDQLLMNKSETKSEINSSESSFFSISIENYLNINYIYGIILLVFGIFIGAILTAIVIRIQGKRNGKNKYHTTNKWDTVGFHKSESNIYFGARYRLNDDNIYKYG